MESENHMMMNVGHGILKKRCLSVCRCAVKRINNKEVTIKLEEDNKKQKVQKQIVQTHKRKVQKQKVQKLHIQKQHVQRNKFNATSA